MMAYEDEELLASVGDSPKVRQALIEESYGFILRSFALVESSSVNLIYQA